jgi:hypothetical protein
MSLPEYMDSMSIDTPTSEEYVPRSQNNVPVGSRYVWILDRDPSLSIVAIQLKDGAVLQQNDIFGDKLHYYETTFRSFYEWRDSLPDFGRMKMYVNSDDDPKWLNWSPSVSSLYVDLDEERDALLALGETAFNSCCEMNEHEILDLNRWIRESEKEYREKVAKIERAIMWKNFYAEIKKERDRAKRA